MGFDPAPIVDLNVGLDEAVVRGVSWDPSNGQVRVLLEVLALLPDGQADPDPRRVLILSEVSGLEVLLRRDQTGAISYGPPVPVPDQAALDRFFDSLSVADAMYGGRMLDDASPTDDWPTGRSLALRFRDDSADHCLYWFTECARSEPGGLVGYRLEGLVGFDRFSVRRADGTSVTPRQFAAAARDWWQARYHHDPRVSSQAQRELRPLIGNLDRQP
jgi:hypothetical protein